MLRNNTPTSPKGFAIVLVVVVLSMLVIIAIPFATSMAVERRAAKNALAETKAKLAAKGALEYAKSRLARSHDSLERTQKDDRYNTPYFDSPQELAVSIDLPSFNTNDSQGHIWSLDIQDEQGKINIHTASPWLLGNLIASAIVEQTIDPLETTIVVDSTFNFPEKDGLLWINGELVKYQYKDDQTFFGCERGLQSQLPNFTEARNVIRGTLIVDAKAYRIISHQTVLGFFRNTEEIKSIGNIGNFTFSPEAFDRIYPLITVHSSSHHETRWVTRQLAEFAPGTDSAAADAFIIRDSLFYLPGMIVKIESGNIVEMAMIMGSGSKITLDRRLNTRFFSEPVFISVLSPNPININTAPPKVLFAIFKGLNTGNSWITNAEAAALTNEIMNIRNQNGFFTSLEGFHNFLEDMRVKYSQTLDSNSEPFFSKKKINRILSAAISVDGVRSRFHGINIRQPQIGTYRQPFPLLSSLVFKTSDTYTIHATGIVNDESGLPLGQHHNKTIVNIIPSEIIHWIVDSQQDFENYLTVRPSTRMISYPNFVNIPTSFPEAEKKENTGVRLDTFTTDYRAPQGSRAKHIATFNNTHEGIVSAESIAVQINGLEILPGSVSFWLKANSGGNVDLFSLGDVQKNQNRISCSVSGGNLVLEVYDGTSEDAHAEITAPISFGRQWNHVMASWYSTDFGGLSLWVDGRPVGKFQYRINGNSVNMRLTTKIKNDSAKISLNSTQGLAPEGAIKIGAEIIEYEKIIGNNLIVRTSYQGFDQNILARGARGSNAVEHPKDVAVVPFGYSTLLNSKVFPATSLTFTIGKDDLVTKTSSAVSTKEDTISVESTKDFPVSGFALLVDPLTNKQEKIRYFNSSSNKLQNCARGQLQTTASDFNAGSFVIPISISVGDNSEYPSSGFVQIDDEWLEYSIKIDKDLLVFNLQQQKIRDLINNAPFKPNYRATQNTISSSHFAGAKVIPVFNTQFNLLGKFDVVTLVNENNFAEQETKEVKWARGSLVAFTEDVSRIYEPQNGTRVLKFPSGELPAESSTLKIGGQFLVDEIVMVEAPQKFKLELTATLDSFSPDIFFNSSASLPTDGGIFKIGDEYISYSRQNNGEFENVKRGFLLSEKNDYDITTPVYPVFFIATSALKSDISGNTINLEDSSDFPRTGYVICDNEIIGYSANNANTLALPIVARGNGSRASFGSDFGRHIPDTLVYSFPARFWDRAIPAFADDEVAFFEIAKTAPGAFWKELNWEIESPSSRFLEVKALARINGTPEWTTEPFNRPGELYQFSEADAVNSLNITGDTIEIRFFVTYKNGAFSRGLWKETPLIKSIKVSYEQKSKVYESE